ncbi:MAG: DUF3015 family protein [Proteobacteria bacterium]|nr:DUF3015 family protein [Pseudomonadota bacterium]
MKRITLALLAAIPLLTIMAPAAPAADKAGSGPNPFSDCGIGAALFSETKWAAVTSNVIWDVGTTAVASATMSPQTCSGKEAKTAAFIFHTYDNLIEETAKGGGVHVATMLDMSGCTQAVRAAIVRELRDGAARDVSAVDYSSQSQREKAERMYARVHALTDGQYASSCTA